MKSFPLAALALLLALLLALVVACSSAPAPTRCTPGASVACVCPGVGTGAQVCAADGSSYSACACGVDAGGDTSVTPGGDTSVTPGADATSGADVAVAVVDAPALDAVTAEDRPAAVDAVAVCDANTLADPANCGACGVSCPLRANAAADCAAGACRFVCRAGFTDCDREAPNGCEVNTYGDAMNCGRCGVRCGTGQVCELGRCKAPCELGRSRCRATPDSNGTCHDLQTERANCGACGTSCDTNTVCRAGACVPG